MSLVCRDVSVRYGVSEAAALRAASAVMEPGTLTLVAGPSGGGKSTFLRALNGLVPGMIPGEVTGSMVWGSTVLDGRPIHERAAVLGTVHQNPDEQLFFERVDDELAFPLENRGWAPAKIDRAVARGLAAVALPGDRPPAVLSGGEKQRLLAEVALMTDPPVVVLDEILANLDRAGIARLMARLRALTARGVAVVMVEHRVDAVLPAADQVLWIADGAMTVYPSAAAFAPVWAAYAAEWAAAGSPVAAERGAPLITVRDLHIERGGQAILRGIDMDLCAGERVVIVGPNGSGKTTLLHALAGLERPTRGRVTDVYRASERYRRIGVVMQNPNYQLFMPTVRAELAFGARSAARVDEVVRALELEDLVDRHPQSLSEGQKRKVGVGAILVMEPDILLLDEPTVGLDLRSLRRVIDLIADGAMTTVTITHDARAAAALGCRRLSLIDGQFV